MIPAWDRAKSLSQALIRPFKLDADHSMIVPTNNKNTQLITVNSSPSSTSMWAEARAPLLASHQTHSKGGFNQAIKPLSQLNRAPFKPHHTYMNRYKDCVNDMRTCARTM